MSKNSKQKKKTQSLSPAKPTTEADLQSEVANFASSLGLSSSLPSSGFNDTDFRKPKSHKNPKNDVITPTKTNNKLNNDTKGKQPPLRPTPKPRDNVFPQLAAASNKVFDRFKNLPKLPLMKASTLGVWYEDAAELEANLIGTGAGRKKVEIKDVEEWKSLVQKKKEVAERLLAQYVIEYEKVRGQSGDIKMVLATQRSGTGADKVSAFSVLVGDNPIANIRSIDQLIGMVTSKVGKRYAFTGFEALKEMFISSLLPDRKLKTLFQQPLNHLPESKDGNSLLLFWHWEECLKQRYEKYISALEEASRDVLATLKDKALKTIYVLLKSKSEQERRLLSALVNKLGDPENKAASNAHYLLSKLLSDHPNMKAVVIDEVDNFLFRPHLVLRAKNHAVTFLSQIKLTNNEDGSKVAKRLVDIYFALFKVLISEAGGSKKQKKSKEDFKKPISSTIDKETKTDADSHVEMDSRLLTVLLNGVNRAFPFVSSNKADDVVEAQTPMLFQLVHSKNFNVGVQALMLLNKISAKNQIVSDRFYRALYSKLLLPSAMNTSKEEMFIGLLLRAMKDDLNLKRVSAFAKRLLQVSLQQPPQYACASLFLLSEVLKSRPHLWNMVLQSEQADDELEHFEDIVEDPDMQASKAADKTDTDGADNNDDDDDDNSEDGAASPAPSSDDEFSDKEDDDMLDFDGSTDLQESQRSSGQTASQPRVPNAKSSLPGGYDPRHREPIYCNADCVGWWELTVLASHVHPSVSTMAKTLLSGAHIVYNGNPIKDLSLGAFLDKFMEKKPKGRNWHGGSQIEPARQLDMSNPLIGADILQLDETDVAPEDVMFHRFYMNKMNSSKKPKKKKKKGTEEEAANDLIGEGDEDDESDNEEIDAILDSSNPALDSDGEYDYNDLDQIADEDDDELEGNASDGLEFPIDVEEDDEMVVDDDSDVDINIGDAEDGSDDEEDVFEMQPRKRKTRGKTGASPFASLEEYEHLMDEDDNGNDNESDDENVKAPKKKRKKSNKKTRRSKPKSKKVSTE
uniref:CCAAT/enhancer-binding protein zeta n=1 Tax=Erigeron canadensis TaxID=72917 RepID=UPI001CB9D549|nr:CCAAT/enhancer-binding protein zeta [Erigeron canadensis]